jgi:hypothetical protein
MILTISILLLLIIAAIIIKKYYKRINSLLTPNLEAISNQATSFNTDEYYQNLSKELGLRLIKKDFPEDQKIYGQGDYRLVGDYKGCQVEMINRWVVKEYTEVLAHGFEYLIDKRIEIKSSFNDSFMIIPIDSKHQGIDTNIMEFDQKFSYLGEKLVLSADQLKEIAKFDWIHLKAENQKLIFIDDYNSWYQNKYGPQAMMHAVHPIWKTSTSNFIVEPQTIKSFLDQLIEIIEK